MYYDFYEAFTILDKLNEEKKLEEAVSETSQFKFLATIEDLYSVLRTRTLWSNNGLALHDADTNCIRLAKETGRTWDYISLTNNKDFKVAKELIRPFGVEFDLNKLKADIEKQNCKLLNYDRFDVTNTPKENVLADLHLCAVVKKKNGSYSFVLQGKWLPRDIDKETYNKLVDWFKNNSSDQLVHFNFEHTNNGEVVSDPLARANGASVYKCFDFIDWNTSTAKLFKKEKKGGEANEWEYYCSNIHFINTPAGLSFTKRIREVSEIWAVCLNKNIGLTTSLNYTHHIYNINVNPIASPKSGAEFALDKKTYNVLKEKLNEDEFRIYIEADKVFRYSKDSLINIWLPNVYNTTPVAGWFTTLAACGLEEAFLKFDNAPNLTDDIMRKILVRLKILNDVELESIIKLYKYLKANNFKYTFFDNSNEFIAKPTTTNRHIKDIFLDDREDANLTKPDAKTFSSSKLDLTRYRTSKSRLDKVFSLPAGNKENASDYSIITLYDKSGNPSVLYKDFSPDGSEEKRACARLQVRGIILGKDEDDNWYINLIKKGDKFNELPGGSFDKLPSSESGLYNIAENKLEQETGLTIKASDMKLLDDIYYVYEPVDSYMVKLVKSVGEDWLWSYTVDWMFLVVLKEPVDVTNNKILSDGKSSWYLVDYILRQPDFLKRYVNIRSIIKDTIK